MTDDPASDSPANEPAPAPMEEPLHNLPLLAALVIAGLEALLLLGAAVWAVVSMVREGFADAAVSIALAVLLVLFGLLLLAGINALWHGRRWGRGPVLTWQLIQGAISVGGVGLLSGWVVYPTLAASLLVALGLLLPASVAATSRSSGSGGTMV